MLTTSIAASLAYSSVLAYHIKSTVLELNRLEVAIIQVLHPVREFTKLLAPFSTVYGGVGDAHREEMSVEVAEVQQLHLRPCKHQVRRLILCLFLDA